MSSNSSSSPAHRDPIEVDPKHYQLEFENDRVRVLRIHYGPREKSPLHNHPPSIVVNLTKCDFRLYNPGGNKQDIMGRPGQIIPFEEPFEHEPENLSSEPFEGLMIEFKT
jgi:quercetin dioxygenase-like cupin family protein